MKPAFLVGVILIVLGIIALAYQGITYTQHKELFSIGSNSVTVPEKKTFPLPPIVGVISLVGGIALVAVGSRK
jgi:hypothetical protein